jgi:hypothetical protein
MGGQTDALKKYREKQQQVAAGGGFKPMGAQEAATYAGFGIMENPELVAEAQRMANPNYLRDVKTQTPGTMQNK